MRTLLPLYADPLQDPAVWSAAAGLGPEATVVVPGPVTGGGVPQAALLAAMRHLVDRGVPMLGRVDLAYAARPVADLLDEVTRWAACPVGGVFFDHAPTSPFTVGPVALAVRVARRAGLAAVVLNPGVPTDPLYRDLDVAVCTFEGSWAEYQRWAGEPAAAGDAHLVHSVPEDRLGEARALIAQRGASLGLATDRTPPHPYLGLPRCLSGALLSVDAAGSGGTSTTTGS